ncbi:MAG: noncanonical pyrimidine nucleotidase, YjjG family [Clostridiales bacterium]|nr:noncanonical pyrimidine nucleotidase, YjjG family [Clostridiales bacterium]
MIRNILLDLDDTILDFHQAEKIALTKTLEHLGIEPEEKILARYSVLNLEQWRLLEQGKLTRKEVKERRYKLLFDEIGADCCAASATKYYENLLGVGHYFIDGAEELLKILSKDYRLYLASNGTAAVQKSRIKSAGIAKYFDDIFISQKIGFDKPDIEFFNYCFSKIMDFKKSETVIVGDSLTSDIKGGKSAGITTVWLNPKGLPYVFDIEPDHIITGLMDLTSLLKGL